MFIKLIEYDIKAGFTVLLPTGLPRHDPVVGYFLKKGHFTVERYSIQKFDLKYMSQQMRIIIVYKLKLNAN